MKKDITTKALMYTILVTWKQYLVLTSFIRKNERVLVKRVPSLQLLLLKLPHPREMLQWITQLGRLIVFQVMDERRIPPWKN
jgi:hypothetical protein